MTRYTVSQAARIAHVSVRALHHYDELGLVVPSARSDAGYRLYSTRDLERLHQVRLYRELDFSLEAIQQLLDDPGFDRASALRAQRRLLVEKLARDERMLRAVDQALAAIAGGDEMDIEKLFEGFAEEARVRWGDTPEHAEAQRRYKKYGAAELAAIKAEADAIEQALAALVAAGKKPGGDEARALAEQHRLHIDRWFYPCSRDMHRRLGELYVADARFAAHYDARHKGLAQFIADAIAANAAG